MTVKSLAGAAILGAFLAMPVTFEAAQAAMPVPTQSMGENLIVPVWGGCGPYGHRGPWGGCRPGGQWSYRPYYARPYYYRPRPYYARPYYGPRYWGPRPYRW